MACNTNSDWVCRSFHSFPRTQVIKPLKEIIMNMTQAISAAMQHAFDMDTPQDLLPLVIANEATLLCGYEAGYREHTSWH
jgi:hypothetical protein